MVILKKDNHYEHTYELDKAQAMVNDGFEVIKNGFGGPKLVKQALKKAEPKKKSKKK
jgi:hypothetical protein